MCTVTFLPDKNGFAFTSSRDESPFRETLMPNFYIHQNNELYYPKDITGKGTWIALDKKNCRMACLLNGAFEKHRHEPPYHRSRGQIVLESFEQPMEAFCKNVDLGHSPLLSGGRAGIVEPFTLILIDFYYKNAPNLIELRWDGTQKYITKKDATQAHIWSSSTLYNAVARQMRQNWFDNWLQKPYDNAASHTALFHRTRHGYDPENDIIMSRFPAPRTVSITQIKLENGVVEMDYEAIDQTILNEMES